MTRRRLNLNREWKFFRGDVEGAAARDFDDSAWQPIGLPHTFDLPYFRTPEFYVGYGWYRKRFVLAPSPRTRGEGWGEGPVPSESSGVRRGTSPAPLPNPLPGVPGRGSKCFLEFDGVFQVAEVFINGRPVGTHRGGYTGFCIDVTDAVEGGENVLAVRVNNNWDPRLQPRAGEHVFCGGIYRDVHLLVTNELHIAWNGLTVTTPAVSRERATVNIRTEIRNDGDESQICYLKSEISDPTGRIVAVTESRHTIEPRSTHEFDQTTPPIDRPMLWHPDHPHLYTVHTRVFAQHELVDEVESPLGFRSFRWTADRGFFLNGEHLYLRGANAHQDHAGWGIGITRAACERDVRLIKEAGFNFVRGAHYPHHPAFADACDRLGLIFWSENAFWGKGGFGPEGYWNASAYPANPEDFDAFEQSCKDQLAEMIRINRNHPSIVAWSMTNEAFFTYHLDRARNLMRELVQLSHALDPTRPAAIGGAQRGDVDHIGDVAGYNGDGARLFINPGVPNMVSEYGATAKPHHAYDPFWGELAGATPASPASPRREQGDAGVAPAPEEYPWRAGQAIWAAFDYGSIAGRQGLKGIINHQRVPKRSWYWYRNAYCDIGPPPEPIDAPPARLRLDADRTAIVGADATEDCHLIVTVLDEHGRHVSATPAVTLTIESGPGEFPTGRSITFAPDSDIEIVQGQCAIAFRSYHGGTSVIRATSPGLDDATITITTIGEPEYVAGMTPLQPDRPYTPPAMSPAAIAAMNNAVNVALNRPCRASTEADARPARLANDGDRSTAWRPSEHDPNPWWMVDLEGFYQLASLRLVFETEGNFRFVVELSDDQQAWRLAIDRSGTDNTRAERNDVFPPGATARYARLRFVHVPPDGRANLAEVELYGILAVR